MVGLAVREIDGAGEVPPTTTSTVLLILPPEPVHVRVKVASLVSGPTVSLPEVALKPDQSLDAVQLSTLIDDQLRVAEPL